MKQNQPKIKFLQIALLLTAMTMTFYFVSCKTNPKIELPTGMAQLRVFNASPDGSHINFYSNDSLITPQGLNYDQSIGYSQILAGKFNLNTKVGDVSVSGSNIKLLFQNDKKYTMFIAGKLAQDTLYYVSTEDDLTLTTDTMAKVRFVNVSPDAPNLDIVFSTKPADSVAVFSSINFRSGTNYRLFKPGTYELKFRKSGEKTDLVDSTNIAIKAAKIYTIWAKGLMKGTGKYALKPGILNDN